MIEEYKIHAKDSDVVWELIGGKPNNPHAQNIQYELKQDKFESRLVVAGDCRLFIIRTKPLKLEHSIHYADITEIHCQDISKLCLLAAEGRQLRMMAIGNEKFTDLLFSIFYKYSSINHSAPLQKRFPKLDVVDELKADLTGSTQLPHLIGPCGNFSNVYRWKCDQSGVEYHEDVAWDVNAIYNSQNCFELILSDFDHLSPKSMIPIVASLEYNDWFKILNLSNIKLTADLQNELLRVLKENGTLEEVNLSNTGIKGDFLLKLNNLHECCSVASFNLSNNSLDDKGVCQLGCHINSRRTGVKSLNLSRTSLTSAGANALGRVLAFRQDNCRTLQFLDLSGNLLRDELGALHNFLAQPNRLKVLKLADTETPLENFFAASLRGCTQHLEHLDLSGCRKVGSIPPSWKHFFSSVLALKSVNFSNNKFSPEAYKLIFEGLEENTVASGMELTFSGCQVGASSAAVQVFEQCVATTTKVSSLDLSDNGFDQSISGIISRLAHSKSLKKLSIGRNLTNVKTKFLHQVVDSLVALVQQDESVLESLSLEGMRLKGDLVDLVNALGLNSSLVHLDISGNSMGDIGAKMLSKALQLNRKLTSLSLDNNQITCVGFECIASSFDRNTSLKILPVPLNDLISASKLNPDRTEKALRKIEHCLHRNNGSAPGDMGPAYRLHQWIMNLDRDDFDRNAEELTRVMNLIDSCRCSGKVKVDEAVVEKLDRCSGIMKEAREVRKILCELHELSEGSFQDGSQLMSNVSKVFVDGTKDYMEKLKSYMNQNYRHSLKSFSQPSMYDPALSAREEGGLDRELRGSMAVAAGRILGPLNLQKSMHMTEFLISSVALSLEYALVNAKSIFKNLSAGEEVSVTRPQGKEEEGKLLREEKRTDSWKNKIRPSSSIAKPLSPEPREMSVSVGSSSDLFSDPVLIETCEEEEEEEEEDVNDGSKMTTSVHSSVSLDDLEVPTERLVHLCKDRPKRPRTKLPTKPIANLEVFGATKEEEEEKDDDKSVEERKAKEQESKKSKVNDKKDEEEDDDDVKLTRKDSDGSANGTFDDKEGIVKKELKKGGIAEGLKTMFSKKTSTSESPDSPPLEKQPHFQSKVSGESKQQQHDSKVSSGAKQAAKESGPSSVLPRSVRERRTTEGATLDVAETKPPARSLTGQVPSSSSSSSAAAPEPSGGNPVASVAKRALPPGAKPGLGLPGFAMPSASEIQLKRLSMRPVSENVILTEQLEEKKPTGSDGTATDSTTTTQQQQQQQAKMRPPPPLAPKPVKSFRDSRRESDTSIGGGGGASPIIVSDDSSRVSEDSTKSKRKEEEPSKPANFMEEFRKRQEKNKSFENQKL